MYEKILIANRGEIACRIARTLRRMGIAVATVHSSADADALHVREIGESVLVGAGPARDSYLDIAAVVAAARRVGADAVHPGFGFLSENAAFARACAQAGIAFIGPTPDTLALFGDKAAAKRLARDLGIPTAGGLDAATDDVETLLAAVEALPRPFILKAVAGGGGKGMRVIRETARTATPALHPVIPAKAGTQDIPSPALREPLGPRLRGDDGQGVAEALGPRLRGDDEQGAAEALGPRLRGDDEQGVAEALGPRLRGDDERGVVEAPAAGSGDALRDAIEAAIREGRSSFGDGRLIAERYLDAARHIEVQILGDGAGNVIHLYDRECTLQRRYQKVVEEAPAASIAQALREQLWAHAVALGRATSYRGLGTVEFAVTDSGAVFLEVNPRLQVEHPVTEAITGLDLVQLQVEAVALGRLPLAQDALPAPRGVAVQARLYAEDAAQGFLPSTGRIAVFEAPPGLRTDAGVAAGDAITPHYDPMIAKLVAHAGTRMQALHALRAGLRQTAVLGVTSNRAFLLALLGDARVRSNDVNTEFIDHWLAARGACADAPAHVAALMALWLAQARQAGAEDGAWHDSALTGWRLARGALAKPAATYSAADAQARRSIAFGPSPAPGAWRITVDGQDFEVRAPDAGTGGWQTVTVDGLALQLRAHCDARTASGQIGDADLALDVQPLHDAARGAGGTQQGLVRAPMMGLMIAVDAEAGQRVAAGQRLATMESMKMEMAITAPVAGRVAWIGCAIQGRVERHQELFRITAEPEAVP